MEDNVCIEKSEKIYHKLAWGMVVVGLMYVLKIAALMIDGMWQQWIQGVVIFLGFVISVMIIWTLAPTLWKQLKGQNVQRNEPEGFTSDMMNQAIRISWGMTFVGMVMVQSINTVLLDQSLSTEMFFNVMFALMSLSASITFLYLTSTGFDQVQDEEWD